MIENILASSLFLFGNTINSRSEEIIMTTDDLTITGDLDLEELEDNRTIICDLDIAAAEIFDDAPAEITVNYSSISKLCRMASRDGGWWCWMESSNKQKCCEREVNSTGDHMCCTLDSKGAVSCLASKY